MVKTTPKTSLFPEIDFASKVARSGSYMSPRYTRSGPRYSFQNLLSRLSNSDSYEIRKGLAPSRFYARGDDSDVGGNRPFTMMLEENALPLPQRVNRI
jgi:hypothetical protein